MKEPFLTLPPAIKMLTSDPERQRKSHNSVCGSFSGAEISGALCEGSLDPTELLRHLLNNLYSGCKDTVYLVNISLVPI